MEGPAKPVLVNVGCGPTPTPGWLNFDNSITVRLARWPRLVSVLARFGLLGPEQTEFAAAARAQDVRFANASAAIPLPDASVAAVYSSHMVEHLDRQEARAFLAECHRVLVPGGTLRLVVPDLRLLLTDYLADGDADAFVAKTLLGRTRPKSLGARLRALIVGDREHHWMYDGPSLVALVTEMGYAKAQVLPPGTTGIPEPGHLDLAERSDESVYVEARRP